MIKIFFSRLGKKQPKLQWEWGLIAAPEMPEKNPCLFILFFAGDQEELKSIKKVLKEEYEKLIPDDFTPEVVTSKFSM